MKNRLEKMTNIQADLTAQNSLDKANIQLFFIHIIIKFFDMNSIATTFMQLSGV